MWLQEVVCHQGETGHKEVITRSFNGRHLPAKVLKFTQWVHNKKKRVYSFLCRVIS